MYLSRIIARNLQGGPLDVYLDRANVIHGDNWSRKTTILNAARLVLVGYLPELGKRNADTFGIASGGDLFVRGEFNDGSWIEREWKAKGDSISLKTATSPGLKLPPTQVLTAMMNADEYFALGATDRERYVFANIPGATTITAEDIAARVEKVAKGYEFAPRWEEAVGLCTDDVSGSVVRPLRDILGVSIDTVRDDYRRFEQQVDRMQKTVAGLIHLRSDDELAPSIDSIKDRRAGVQRQLDNLNEAKGTRIAAFTRMTGDRQRRDAIAREINHSEKDLRQLAECKDLMGLLKAKLESLPDVTEALAAAVVRLANARAYLGQTAANMKRAADLVSNIYGERQKVDAATVCPFCGASGEGWKALRIAELETAGADAMKVHGDALTAGAAADEELRGATEAKQAIDQQKSDRDTCLQRITDGNALIARLELVNTRVIALKEEQVRLLPDDPELTAAVETAQTEINVLAQEARDLDALLATVQQRAGDLVRLAQAEKERDEAAKLKDLALAAGKELAVIRGEIVEAAFGPLLATANAIFGGILPSPLAFKDGEVGTWRSGAWIGHRTFSGAEKALTYAAIQAALAAASPVKIMLLDELGRFTGPNAEKVATQVVLALRECRLDQFLGVDPERVGPYDVGTGEFAFKHHSVS